MARFRMAESQADVDLCYGLMDTEGVPREGLELKAPIIMAFGDLGIVGFLGTHLNDDDVFGGPLVIREGHAHGYTVYNLCELYEIALRRMGIKQYAMSVEDGTFFDDAIKRYNPPGMEQYAREGNKSFYIRRL